MSFYRVQDAALTKTDRPVARRVKRQRGACIVVLLSAAVLVLLGLGGVVDLAAHLLRFR